MLCSDQADGQYTGSSSSSSSSTHSGSSSTHSGSSGTSSAGPERLLLGAQQQKCTQYAAQVNNHNRNGYKLAVQKYRNPQQCPAVCKMYESSVPSGVFRVQCNVASCTCTGTAVTSQAKVMFGITDAGRFSFTALYPPQCTAAMSAKCAGVYEWCRGC
jgi:hypothetical protein